MINIPHLETNITISCQNRCIACNHFVPMQVGRFKASMMPPEVLKQDLTNLARICHAGAFALIGGEPTLHRELEAMAMIAQRSGIADSIELWSHGQEWGKRWGQILLALPFLDKVVISRYPGKATDQEIDAIQEICATYKVSCDIKDEGAYPNFTQLLEPADTGPEVTQVKYQACWFKGYSRVIDWGYFYRCCTSPFLPQLLQGREEGADGLKIDATTTEEDLKRFLGRHVYMPSCTICAGRNTPSAVPITWQEIKDPARWQRLSAGIEE